MSTARAHLAARIHLLEQVPQTTKTSIKAEIFADRSIDWRTLRDEEPLPRPPNWKTNLISRLLQRHFSHGGARRRHGGTPSSPHASTTEPVDDIVPALCRVLDLLAERDRDSVRRHLLLPPTIPHNATTTLVRPRSLPHLMGRRHIDRWRGMRCFTVRILDKLNALQRDITIRHGCEAVHAWWQREGRFLAHFRLRPGNRLTAQLPLVYTNLPPEHPVHTLVLAQCRCGQAQPASPVVEAASQQTRDESEHDKAQPATITSASSSDGTTDVWRLFTRRSPVLALYQPVYQIDTADNAVTAVTAPPSSSLAALACTYGWSPERAAAAVVMAQHLYPELPWAQWADTGVYEGRAPERLRQAAALLQGFGEHASSVLEAVRLGHRAATMA